MPYLILVIGVLIGFYVIGRLFRNADPKQIRIVLATLGSLALTVVMLGLSMSGRLPLALAIVIGALPVVWRWILDHQAQRKKKRRKPAGAKPARMTRAEALEVLGLAEGADPDDITAAYKKLMKKAHPDQDGSDWLASRINEARDVLLKGKS